MLFISLYTIISVAVLYFPYLLISKKWNRFKITKPFTITLINFILTLLFFVMFITNPQSFSSDAEIGNKLLYVIFTIFVTYFYCLIIPISGINIIVIIKNSLYSGSIKKTTAILFSIISIILIAYISVNIF